MVQSELHRCDIFPDHVDRPMLSQANRAEIKALCRLALPAIGASACAMAMGITDQVMVGHLGREPLAAAAVGNVIFNLMLYFLMGLCSALDTFATQAHGAQERSLVVTWTVTGLFVVTASVLPAFAVLACSEPLSHFVFLQTREISILVGQFCWRLLPGLLPHVWSLCLQKALTAQNEMLVPALVTLATFLVNIPFNLLFIRAYGFVGAPLATSASRIVGLAFTVLAMLHSRACALSNAAAEPDLTGSEALEWPAVRSAVQKGFRWSAVQAYAKLGLPGGAAMCMEAGMFDLTTALAGLLGVIEVDAHVVMLSVISFNFYAFPFGIATAASIRVGNLLGAGRPEDARRASWLSVGLGATSMAICGTGIMVLRGYLGYVFISDDRVAAVVSRIAVIAAAFETLDGTMGTSQGALRGLGRHLEIAGYNLVGFWFVGFASAATLTFPLRLGVPGLWLGLLLGLNTTALLNIRALLSLNWDKEASLAVGTSALPPAVTGVSLGPVGSKASEDCIDANSDCGNVRDAESVSLLVH